MLTAPPVIASSMVIPSGQEPLTSSSMPNGYSHSSMDEDAPAELDITPKSEPNSYGLIESHPVSESSPNPMPRTTRMRPSLQLQMEKRKTL